MNFTEEQVQQFYKRIDKLEASQKPLFGSMNANEMICHCTDFFRMAKGIKKAKEYGVVDPEEVLRLARSGKTAPVPKGFRLIKGEGTLPTNFKNDKSMLKEYIIDFSALDKDFEFAEHPYFGKMTRNEWIDLAMYHLNHHLKQFAV